MRVLCIDPEPSSKRGGQELSMLDETRGLVALGHDVTLGYGVHADLVPQHERGGVRTLHLPQLAFAKRPLAVVRFAKTVSRIVRERPDVIVLNQYHESFVGASAGRLAHVPLVCHLRLFPPSEFCGQWRLGVSSVSRFIAVSGAVKQAWVSERGCDPDRIDVVHDGIDLSRFRRYDTRAQVRAALGVPQDAFVVLYAGRLDRTKHLEELLRVFAALELPAHRARLLVAGRPVDHPSEEAGAAYVESLRALAASLGIAESVHWLGSRPDVPELLSASDMAALFQLYPEPLARAAYESLACGTPIICQRAGGMTEVLSGEFSWLTFDGRDRTEVVALIRRVMRLPQDDPGFAERARAHAVSGFSKERMVQGIANALERAVATRPLHRGPPLDRLRGRLDPVPVTIGDR
jgi:glycosyltransferase involved in cell wall biosynthesis